MRVQPRLQIVTRSVEGVTSGLSTPGVSNQLALTTATPERPEQRGVLEQTLISAFDEPDVVELVRNFVAQRSRRKPKLQEIVQSGDVDRLRQLLPEAFVQEAQKALEKHKALLILRVDETDAFDFRRLLEEDTRSTWTIAVPPEVSA